MHLPKGILIGLFNALALCALACSDPPADIESHPVPQDLTHTEAGKADSTSFNANKLMTDEVFEDADFITANDIQRFLEETPYGHPSFMATYAENGMSVAEKIVAGSADVSHQSTGHSDQTASGEQPHFQGRAT